MEQSIAFLVGVILVLVIMNIIRSTRLNSRVTSLEDDLETIHDWVDGIEEELGDVRDELADLTSDCQELLDDLESELVKYSIICFKNALSNNIL